MSKDFFNGLNKKLSHEPSKDFDKDFWNKFNEEFNHKPARVAWFMKLVPVGVCSILLLAIGLKFSNITPSQKITKIKNPEILQNLDLLMHIDDEVFELAEEDLNELLEEERS